MSWKYSFVATGLIAMLLSCGSCHAQLKNWDGPNLGLWNGPFHWSPAGAPAPSDTVFIGVIAGTENSNVVLSSFEQIQNIEIRNGSDLFINDVTGILEVADTTTIGGEFNGAPSRLNIDFGSGDRFQTDRLIVESDGHFSVFDESFIDILDELVIEPGGEVSSNGSIGFFDNVGRAINNNGIIRAGTGGLQLTQQGNSELDLDGSTGNGILSLVGNSGSTAFRRLAVFGVELFDDFSGTIEMATGSSLTMVLDTEWVADENSLIHIESQAPFLGQLARISGTDFRLEGTMLISDGISNMGDPVEIDANMTVAETAVIELEQDTFLRVFDPTIIEGGTFITASGSAADGSIRLGVETHWQGVTDIFGTLRQAGDAIVNSPAVINAITIDLDGDGSTLWDINSALTVNANLIDETNNVFNGCFYLESPLSSLQLNIDSGETWFMNGELIMANTFPFPVTKLSGTPVEFSDEVFVQSAGNRIDADSTFNSTSYIEFSNPDASLILNGNSSIHQNADLDGVGTLIVGSLGELSLGDGFFQDQVALINQGTLQIADGPGIATVPEFNNAANGFFSVEIGGNVAGTEFDFLTVSDEVALLAGRIQVKLTNGFQPVVGDEFSVLSAPAGIIGQFNNSPVSIFDGNGYVWEVLNNPFDITVRLQSIEPNVILGDVNQDGMVNLLDVMPFVDAINGPYEIRADINCDGVVDLLDVSPLIELISI